MKRIVTVLLIIILFLLFASYLKPVVRQKQVFVGSTFENIIASVFQPKNWINWDTDTRQAWLTDSSVCHFSEDTVTHVATIDIPGKKVRITQLSYLLYQVEETKNNAADIFSFSVIPYVGNGQARSEHNSRIAYTEQTRLFFSLFPSLEGTSFSEGMLEDLRSYLENNTRFYGFPIELKQTNDSLFIAKKETYRKKDFFKQLPSLFAEIEQYARQNGCTPYNRNVYYNPTGKDSLEILAGVNIPKKIVGDYLYNFMQFPAGQPLLVGHYEGAFHNKPLVYQAMEKYLSDHQLMKGSVSFEKYLSPLPTSDTSIIKIELSYPLRY